MTACQDPLHPMIGGVDVDHAIRAGQRLSHARRTSEQSVSALPNLVKFLIQFPDEPRQQQPPAASGVFVALALTSNGEYVIEEIAGYAST